MYTTKDKSESSIQQVQTLNELQIGTFVIINDNDDFLLSKIKLINHLTQEIQVQYYEPPFPATIFYVSRSRNRNNFNINIQNIVLLLRHNPVLGKQDEVYLNHEQFTDIKSICEEF